MKKENGSLIEIEVGMREFRQIVGQNGGFKGNKNVDISLTNNVATFQKQIGKEIVCYVLKKGGKSNHDG